MALATTKPLDEGRARELTERICRLVDAINGQFEKLVPLVVEAYTGRVWLPLEYESWEAYVSAEVPRIRIGREERRELVAALAEQARLSTRAIAPVVGASVGTVHSDLRCSKLNTSGLNVVGESSTTDVADGASESGGVVAGAGAQAESSSRPTRGLDGKDYVVPPPRSSGVGKDVGEASQPNGGQSAKARRRPITDAFRHTARELHKRAESLQRLVDDDRFARNKDQLSSVCRGELMTTADILTDVLNQLSK